MLAHSNKFVYIFYNILKAHISPIYGLHFYRASTEHVLYDAPIIVREDEPSSIIAYTLSCSDYLKELHAMQESHAKGEMKMEELNAPEDNDTGSDWVNLGFEDTASISGTSIEKTLLKDTGTHIKYRELFIVVDECNGDSRLRCSYQPYNRIEIYSLILPI